MNKKLYLFFSVAILIIISSVIMCFTVTDTAVASSSDTIENKPTIIIDPGHGGEDGGATCDNIVEKDINLLISQKLKLMFLSNGFDVIMTRETDTDISDKNVSNKKRSDLLNRVDIFNNSENNIVISIHQNKFAQSEYSGTQIFYSKNNEKSALLAQNIQQSVTSLLQPNNSRECKKAGSEILVLDNTDVPAVMVECGFLSNQSEAQKLINDTYQNELAFSIYLGFMEFYYTNY